MEISQYLIISPGHKKFAAPVVKLIKRLKGSIPSNAIALHLNIQIPDAVFQKPKLQATIIINESDVSKPSINAEVIDNIKLTLSQNFGIDMNIQIVEPEKSEG